MINDIRGPLAFHDDIVYLEQIKGGLSRATVEEISALKGEPDWMLQFRLRALEHFLARPMPEWGGDLSHLDFNKIVYYRRASERQERRWEDVPEKLKLTFEKLGIPEAERKFLSGAGAQFDSDTVYHSVKEELSRLGVVFTGTDEALKEYPDLFRKYFATVVPPEDNKFAALNSAFWSGGSFVWIPKGVEVPLPLQAYFRINAENTGQFERTLIIAEEGAKVAYIEGCLPAGEQISIGDRWVNVESVRPGDSVIGDDGLAHKVKTSMVRPYRGPMLTIRPVSSVNAFRLTPEHPVLAIARADVASCHNPPKDRKILRTYVPHLDKAAPRFMPAGELKAGDYLVFPRIGPQQVLGEDVLSRYPDAMMRLLGYYLAEGSIGAHEHMISIDFHSAETDLVEDVVSSVETLIGRRPKVRPVPDRKAVRIAINSTELVKRCLEACGRGSSTKQLSEEVMSLPVDKIALLVRTWEAGDGHVNIRPNGGDIQENCTTSPVLAIQLQEVLARMGVYAGIYRRKVRKTVIWGRSYNIKESFMLIYSRKAHGVAVVMRDDYFLVPVKKVDRQEDYAGFVFNLEVADCSSYLARGFAVHNCSAPTYTTDALHAAVVEVIAQKDSKVRYVTQQAWSNDVYNLVTKRAHAYENSRVEWLDANVGCLTGSALIEANGREIPISQVRPGDLVASLGQDSHVVRSPVVATKQNQPRPAFELQLGNGMKVAGTQNHPFLVAQPGGRSLWLPMSSLTPGDEIRTIDGSSPVLAASALGDHETYDLQVAQTQNFLANGIFAHNSRLTMKYPSIYLRGRGASAEIVSVAVAGPGQHQDTGAKAVHLAPDTKSHIVSKSISYGGGRATYRGNLKVAPGATGVVASVRCDALMLDDLSRSDTYPYIDIQEDDTTMTHEATVGKISADQIFYLMSRGLTEDEAQNLVIQGFLEVFTKELPMEYAVEFNRLIRLEMTGSLG
jgi:Fe-S cluster assembly protein SufB